MKHVLEYREGGSAKFWEIEVRGCEVVTHWGRVGTAGQTMSKSHGNRADAEADAIKQMSAKLKKGYAEVAGTGEEAPPAAPAAAKALAPPAPARPSAAVPACPPPAGPQLDGSTNLYESPTGARFRLFLVEGDFPDPFPLGTKVYIAEDGSRYQYPVSLASLRGVRWSPDSRRCAVLDQEAFVYEETPSGGFHLSWRSGSGTQQRPVRRDQPDLPLGDAAFSPDAASLMLACQSNDDADACLLELDAATGKERGRIPLPNEYPQALAIHPGGQLFGVVSGSNYYFVPFLVDRKGHKTPLGRDANRETIAFDPRGERVAIVSRSHARVFDLKGRELWCHPEEDESRAVAWLPDGRLVLEGKKLVDLTTGSIQCLPLPDIEGSFENLLVDPQGRFLGAAFTHPPRLLCWDLQGRIIRELRLSTSHGTPAAMVAPDGRILGGVAGQKEMLLFCPEPRYAVVSEEAADPEKRFKAKTLVFADRDESYREATKQIAAREKKGFHLVSVTPPMTEAERAEATRWEQIRSHKVLSKLIRRSFRPRTVAAPPAEPCGCFLGPARLLPGEAWPSCPNCHGPLTLLAELDLDRLPEGAAIGGEGLLQVWYCTSSEPLCEVDTEAFAAGAGKSKMLRLVPKADAVRSEQPAALAERKLGAPAWIEGWDAQDDLAGEEEIKQVSRRSVEAMGVEDLCDELPRPSDKLGGWPAWLQDAEYPACPRCRRPMSSLVLQLKSNGLAGWQWGDLGIAYVLQCPDHPEALELISQGG